MPGLCKIAPWLCYVDSGSDTIVAGIPVVIVVAGLCYLGSEIHRAIRRR